METWESSEFEPSGPEEPPGGKPPASKGFWYVTGSLVIVLMMIAAFGNGTPQVIVELPAPEALPERAQPLEVPRAVPVAPPAATTAPALPAPAAPPAAGSLAELVAVLRPSVVYLWYEQGPARLSGTGFVVDDRGHILTNAHVVSGTDEPGVMTNTGQRFLGHVVARSREEDLALVQAPLPPDTPMARLAGADGTRIGDEILVFGFPMGLFSEVTVTPGIVSSIRREENRVQLSAAINPGNSGGPVFNRSTADVVAVVVSKLKTGEAMGFAIPIASVRTFLEESLH